MADTFSSPAQPQSMEAILASIKRIIDEPATTPPSSDRVADVQAAGDGEDDDVLELGAPASGAPVMTPLQTAPPAPTPQSPEAAPLVSASTREASLRAMAALTAVAVDPHAPANTLDGLVREMLRPMLKEWLDVNLPDLVERVVAREVARLGGG